MALPRYTPGSVKVKRKPPHGHSQRTLTYKQPKHHAAHHAHTASPSGGTPAPDPLDMPITPGSSITRRQAQRMAHNATNVRYGGQETGINQQIASNQQLGVDQAGWYKQYLDALHGYQVDTQNRAQQTNDAVKALSDSFRGLDQSNATAQQGAMQADAANRGATVDPRLAQDASNASLVRQALQGSLGALIAQHGLSAGNQASNLANVVGPGQRLQAQAQNMRQTGALQEQKTSLKGQEGSFAQTFLDSLSQNEAKNILAASIASGRDLTAQERITETTRHNKASEKNTAASRKSAAAAKGQTVNKYGYTAKQWAAYSPEERRKIMAQVRKEQRTPGKGPKAAKPTQGPGSLTSGQESHVVQQVKGAKAAALSLMSKPGAKSGEVRQLLAAGKVDGVKYSHDAINAAFDLLPTKYGGHGGLSPANVKALHRMGIHVNGVFPILKNVKGLSVQQTAQQNNIFGLPPTT